MTASFAVLQYSLNGLCTLSMLPFILSVEKRNLSKVIDRLNFNLQFMSVYYIERNNVNIKLDFRQQSYKIN